MITFCTPYDFEGNLARAYNKEVTRCDTPYLAICDRDILFTSPMFAERIKQVIETHGAAFYTCKTNRAACKWQLSTVTDWNNDNLKDHDKVAEILWRQHGTDITDHTNSQLWSGFFMVIPVEKWKPLPEGKAILGVDNQIHNRADRVLLMEGIYCYHWYRGGNRADKRHLQ